MAGPSTNTTQRLLRELKDYAKSPNEVLLHLGPVDDEDLLRWEAVLKGVNGTPYEGNAPSYSKPPAQHTTRDGHNN
jgi:peroxin-4